MAERFDSGWQASIDGGRLAAKEQGWQQTFQIPANAKGRLDITYRESWQWLWRLSSTLAIIISLISATPLQSRREV